jgi:HPt (histidine-containing phosphotransfer) domain-containing protein
MGWGRSRAVRRADQLGEGATPTLDVQYLQKLVKASSLEAAESFAADYTAFLPRFVERITRTVDVRDKDLAVDASHNLKTKSWLIGALRMNQLCSEFELALALGDWAAASAVAQDIGRHLPCLQKALHAGQRLAVLGHQVSVTRVIGVPLMAAWMRSVL